MKKKHPNKTKKSRNSHHAASIDIQDLKNRERETADAIYFLLHHWSSLKQRIRSAEFSNIKTIEISQFEHKEIKKIDAAVKKIQQAKKFFLENDRRICIGIKSLRIKALIERFLATEKPLSDKQHSILQDFFEGTLFDLDELKKGIIALRHIDPKKNLKMRNELVLETEKTRNVTPITYEQIKELGGAQKVADYAVASHERISTANVERYRNIYAIPFDQNGEPQISSKDISLNLAKTYMPLEIRKQSIDCINKTDYLYGSIRKAHNLHTDWLFQDDELDEAEQEDSSY